MKRARTSRGSTRRFAALILVALAAAAVAAPALAAGAGEAEMPAEPPALGSKAFSEPFGAGFGRPEPKVIFNGGDPSGEVSEIHWRSWGGPIAIGYGRNPIFRPQGGYYRKPGRVELRANKLGMCAGKRRLHPPRNPRPQASRRKLGKWFLWSGAKTICKRLARRPPIVRRDHPVRPTARPRRDEAAERAPVVDHPAVAAFGQSREARDERRGARPPGSSARSGRRVAGPAELRRPDSSTRCQDASRRGDGEVGEQPSASAVPSGSGRSAPGSAPAAPSLPRAVPTESSARLNLQKPQSAS